MRDAECWVTIAESDEQAWNALVLAQSIRKTMSSRPVTIITSEDVSRPLRLLLQKIFDAVLVFDIVEVGQKGYSCAVLCLWNMRMWKKCVFIQSHSYLVRNSDELFSMPAFSTVVDSVDGASSDFSVFVFTPNPQELSVLTEASDYGDVCEVLDKKFKACMRHPENQISRSFVSLSEAIGSPKTKIITNVKPLSARITQDVRDQWVSTFNSDVLGEIEHVLDIPSQKLLWQSIKKYGLPRTVNKRTTSVNTNAELRTFRDAIAVIGMSCRFPGANDAEEFWNLLITKQDPVTKFPPTRPVPPDQPDALERHMEAGFLKCAIDEFDAKFFEISPREAIFVDPQQRLLLEVVWESIENANVNPFSLSTTRTGVYVGIYKQDYDHVFADDEDVLTPNEFTHRYFGNAFSQTASRVSHFLNLQGPNYCIESGSSSSANAIHLAVQSLRAGETTVGIACGVHLVLRIESPIGGPLDSPVLSKDFRCKSFDECANGFVRAEGCGAVVLKTLPAAIRDGDNVIALIRGTSLNHDGHSTSVGTPNGKAQEKAIRRALLDAAVKPSEVSFVEAHGTGTVVGDPIEMSSISAVYSENRTQPLIVGSVKSNIGHCETAAGVAGFIKVLLCMKHQMIPPQLHLHKVNPKIDMDSIPAIFPLEVTSWDDKIRIAGMNSFSFSGTNVHLVIQETPQFLQQAKKTIESERPEMIGISAKSAYALEALRSKYLTFLTSNLTIPITDVAFTMNTGRAQMPHRIALVAKDASELMRKLDEKSYGTKLVPSKKPKIVFLFTGQGSQYFGLAHDLYDATPVFRSTFDQLDSLFTHRLKVSLKVVLWQNPALLQQTVYCQPAIFSVQISLARLWESFGIFPDFVIGHSVGEFCASVVAGLLSLEDGMKLLIERSLLLDSLPAGKMLVVKTCSEKCQRLIYDFAQDGIDIAAENSPDQTVVSGSGTSVEKFAAFCKSVGVRHQMLTASHGFHSREMDPILSPFRKVASTINHGKLNCSYISSTLGREVNADEIDCDYWTKHLRHKVQFQKAITLLWKQAGEGILLVEIGPQPILLSLAMANASEPSKGTFCPSLRKSEVGIVTMLNSLTQVYLAGIEISWNHWYHRRGNKVALPTYPFQRQKYWYYPKQTADLKQIGRIIPNSPSFHPILGCQLEMALGDQVFSQQLSLEPDLSYMSDHCVANKVILPAAAFLETIMAAGARVMNHRHSAQRSVCVTNFAVKAPLELAKTQIQTIVRTAAGDEEGEHKQCDVEIHQLSDEKQWRCHACAVLTISSRHTTVNNEMIDLKEVIAHMDVVDVVTTAYELWAKAGIQFGPKFRSIIRAWTGKGATLSEISYPENISEKYICHPIVLDAMIQTHAFRTFYGDKEATEIPFQLPVGIQQFTWHSNKLSPMMYILSTESTISLFNEFGVNLASMEGLEFRTATISNFLKALSPSQTERQTENFMEEVWQPTNGVTTNRLNCSEFTAQTTRFVKETIAAASQTEVGTMGTLTTLDTLFVDFLLRGIMDCAWHWPEVGQLLSSDDWAAVAPQHLKIATILRILQKHGYLAQEGSGYRIRRSLSKELIETQILSGFESLRKWSNEKSVIYRFTTRCNQHFSSAISSQISPLSYLFPTEVNECGAIEYYQNGIGQKFTRDLATSALLDCVAFTSGNTTSKVLRILEVGSGSGICCGLILKALAEHSIPCEYTLTDISPHSLHDAQDHFQDGVTFGILDIEEDPLSQGFPPEQFDIIVAINAVHATGNVSRTLDNLRVVLAPNGILILGEVFREIDHVSLTLGFLEEWWKFNDGRKDSPFLDLNHWVQILGRANFTEIRPVSMFNNTYGVITARKMDCTEDGGVALSKTWGIVTDHSVLSEKIRKKLEYFGRTAIDVSLIPDLPPSLEGVMLFSTEIPSKPEDGQEFCKNLLSILQRLVAKESQFHNTPRVVVVTRGVYYMGDASTGNPNVATADSLVRTFVNERPDFSALVIDLDQDETNEKSEVNDIFGLIWIKDNEMFKKRRDGKVFVQRLVYSAEQSKKDIPFPDDARYLVTTPSLNDIQISKGTNATQPTGTQVEIEIQAVALNFRDLLLILQPDGFNSNFKPVSDVGGIVIAAGVDSPFNVGDTVFGYLPETGFASHTIASSERLLRKPSHMSLTSAVSLPLGCLTVLDSLQDCAQLRPRERILIHAATGGVGLQAIQYAKHIEAEIHATAGSRRKQEYLKSLGIKYVYYSRNTEFGEEIIKNTGNGVDVVLSSLTGTGFKEASLKACRLGGRFVEIGKINIWTFEQLRELRPDVKYFVIDLIQPPPEKLTALLKSLEKNIELGVFGRIPHQTFPLRKIREALKFFQGAKHIGKVVIRMPIVQKSVPLGKVIFEEYLFHAESTYLITGGLGGLGLEVAKWMCSKGACHLILASRGPPSAKAHEILVQLNSNGCRVVVMKMDVGSFSECESTLRSVETLRFPPVRGVMHAACVLSDAMLENQTWDKFETVFRSKINGTWNLHRVTQSLDLEFFVVFSSMSGIIGTPGACNYAAANRFLDSFTHYRHSLGLPATAINYGPWAEVGIAIPLQGSTLGNYGINFFGVAEGLKGTEEILSSNFVQTIFCHVADWHVLKQRIRLGNYFKEIGWSGPKVSVKGDGEKPIIANIEHATPEERQQMVEKFVENSVKETLRITAIEELDRNQNFFELGIDSLMTVELRNGIQAILGQKQLTISALQTHRNIASLAAYIVQLMDFQSMTPGVTVLPQAEALVYQDCILPSDIRPSSILPATPSEFKHLLLTGATGHLGVNFLPVLQRLIPTLYITCIVRADTSELSRLRLTDKIKIYLLQEKVNVQNINVVCGDLSKPHFGLALDVYSGLADSIDAVIHCAAKPNHLENYDAPGNDSIRIMNVFTTLNVLRFTITGKTKRIMYASTLVAGTSTIETGELEEEFPADDDFGKGIRNGYALSKFICDKLMAQAFQRGIPVTVIRYAAVLGNSETGFMPVKRDHAYDFLLTCMLIEKLPSFVQNGIPVIAVDTASEISATVFLSDKSELGVYNLTSGYDRCGDDLKMAFRNVGIKTDYVASLDWLCIAFDEKNRKKNRLIPYKSLYPLPGNEYVQLHPLATRFVSAEINMLSKKMLRNCPNIEEKIVPVCTLIERHLRFYLTHGKSLVEP